MDLPARPLKDAERRKERAKQASGPKSIPAASHAANAAQCPGEDAKSFLCDEQLLRHVEDLTKVNPVTATTVLKCLELRYAAEVFYTNAGCSLVAVNPFRLVPQLYSPELMKEYHTAARLQELKPHIFVAAEETYRNVESRIPPVNQSIIVSGESGAGKTWTSRCLMRFYATVAASATIPKGSVAVERIEKRVLDSNPVMEAFGNACTLRNSNSSRFGKYIQLQLNRSQLLTSASIQTFLLEKTRVAYQAPHERNFHIFYQIAKGATQEQRLEWDLPEDLTFSWLPNSEKALEADRFEVAREAMSHLGIEDSTQNNVFKILAGLLHLGNIRYLESEDESQPCGLEGGTRDFAKTAARLLQVPVEELLDTLRIRTITAGKQRQVFKKACPKAECETRRDCLAKVIYAQLFDWLVAVINESISAEPSVWDHFIGLLDVYGFESFPDNHLEQLCINYANEKLQQHFVGHFLKAQQEEYAAEGLEWSFIDYRDNQRGLDAIEGSPVSIFSLLNEECRLNRASSAGQLQARIEAALASNPCVSRDRLSKEANFIVAHFAGRVCYQLEGMVEKNKDPVPPELVLLLQLSRDPLLQELFTSQKADEDTTKPQTKPVVVTVVSKFKGSLEQLMGLLHSTTPHYIRCLKPNARCEAAVFRKDEVLRQLEACGIVEAVNISAAGFPVRLSFRSFLERYALLKGSRRPDSKAACRENGLSHIMENGWTTPASAEEERDAFRSAVQDILWHVCPNTAPLNPTESTPCATPAYCAKTKVFMTNSTLELLEARRAGALSQKAFCIQCCWRRFKRRKAAKEKRSATVIQSAVRSWLARKHFQRLRKAAVVIKRAWKKWKAKMGVLAAEELDGVDGKLPSFAGATASFSQAPGESDKAWPLNAIIRLWPLGLVLASAPVRMTASQSRLALLTCLQGLPKGDFCKAGARLPRDGIASIRALPQGSVRFRCRRSPLLHAEVRPHCRSCTLSGFNQILLDARQLLSA
ncbi:unconventional myosin-XIX isoform X1 [Varanus komodoensis]|uniref:unconventional myosin-XIX isoform X1 n=1 Tax=Varanus komodoensis TaxID=61221 RepID=UPI001CF768E5|nr:unconventional myosin-XIX isoform X1 [Varanus komodoensis]